MIKIQESQMNFGPFQRQRCFHIEKSEVYLRIQQKVQIAEFLLLKDRREKRPSVWVVEAKSSSPRPENTVSFDAFINEIKNKMINAFSLTLASCLKRHKDAKSKLPEHFQYLNLAKTNFRFVLVIQGHQDSWLPPIQDALTKEFFVTTKTWAIAPNSVAVLNRKLAIQKGLVASEPDDDE